MYSRLNIKNTRALYESFTGPNRTQTGGRMAYVNTLRHMLGLCDKNGNNHRDAAGNRILLEAKVRPEAFSVQELAAAIVGYNWQDYFNPDSPGSLQGAQRHRSLVESQFPGDPRALMEAVGVGVDVSAFADINAWTSVVGGLIEVKILEAFRNPEFIADRLMPAVPTKLDGQKIIGAARMGNQTEFRQPGQPHRRAGFGERWVLTPPTQERALACDVYKEAVFFDLTGQVLEHAEGVGEWVGYQKELTCIDAFIGVTSQSGGYCQFNYKGSNYSTYVTSLTNGYLNSQSNELLDWTNLESSWLLFIRAQDPETSTRILINPNSILVNPQKLNTAKLIMGTREAETRTSGGNTQSTAPTLQIRRGGNAPYAGEYDIIWSPLVEQRCTDASGLNLSQANANKYWWHFEKGKPFKYMQNWPLTISQAPPTNYEMMDRGLIASFFANERGTPATVSPWHVVENTN